MEKNYLIINSGSSSKKYALFEGTRERGTLHFEKNGQGYLLTQNGKERAIGKTAYDRSLQFALETFLKDGGRIAGVALRIVAPGPYFQRHRIIDNEFIKKFIASTAKAPLHIPPVLREIALLKKVLPGTPLAGISDSAFHSTMPEKASRYALPRGLAAELELFRYGYHGISCAAIAQAVSKMFAKFPARMIICHLGSGASITAVKNGKSIDTSMGFSPLEGLSMSTRSGDIDPEALLYILQSKKMSPTELLDILYHNSGLFGMSGISDDMRVLLAKESKNSSARSAIDVFIYRIQKYIGAYSIALGGIDCLVFTGTMGERSSIVRQKICASFGHFRVSLDQKKNARSTPDAEIQNRRSAPVLIIHSQEMRYMAEVLRRLLHTR